MAPVISNVLLVGNSGVGKSYLLNSVGGNFKSGFNIVDGLTTEISYCDVTIGGATVRLIDVPGLLEATDEKVAQNAVAITKALRMKGGFKLILVLPECAGRIQPSDLYTIGKVLSSIGFSIDVGLIINKVHEDDLENYADSGVRNDVLNKLNTLAEGKIKGSWFTVIPRFGKNNPTGANPYMTSLLTDMTSQNIANVNKIRATNREFDIFVEFLKKTIMFFVGMWDKFIESLNDKKA